MFVYVCIESKSWKNASFTCSRWRWWRCLDFLRSSDLHRSRSSERPSHGRSGWWVDALFFAGHGPTAATGDQCRPGPRFLSERVHVVVSWNRGTPSHHPFLDRIFHEMNRPFGDTPMTMEPPMWFHFRLVTPCSVKVAPNSLAEDWNRRFPGRAVRKGYRLVKVPRPSDAV